MNEENKLTPSKIIKKIFKAICICIILTVYIIIFARFFTSCDSEIVDTLLKTDEMTAAYEESPETFEIHSYEITDWYKSKTAAGDESGNAGKLLCAQISIRDGTFSADERQTHPALPADSTDDADAPDLTRMRNVRCTAGTNVPAGNRDNADILCQL